MASKQFSSVNLHMSFYLRTLIFILFVAGFGITSLAQVEEVERIIYLAKAIKRITIKLLDSPESTAPDQPNKALEFEVTAYDDKDQPVNIHEKEAKELLNVKVKNPLGSNVIQKDKVDFLTKNMPDSDKITDTERKYQQVIRLITDKGNGNAKLEVRIADKYSKYSKAVGRQLVSTGGAPVKESAIKNLAKNMKSWAGEHPYLAVGGGAVAVGGVAVAAGGGGGGSNGSSGTGGGGGSGANTAAYAGHMAGGWSGISDGMPVGGSFSINIGTDGTISGSYSGDYSGSLSGRVSGNGDMTAQGSVSGGSTWSGHLSISGGVVSGSGTWSGQNSRGSWSGGG